MNDYKQRAIGIFMAVTVIGISWVLIAGLDQTVNPGILSGAALLGFLYLFTYWASKQPVEEESKEELVCRITWNELGNIQHGMGLPIPWLQSNGFDLTRDIYWTDDPLTEIRTYRQEKPMDKE